MQRQSNKYRALRNIEKRYFPDCENSLALFWIIHLSHTVITVHLNSISISVSNTDKEHVNFFHGAQFQSSLFKILRH